MRGEASLLQCCAMLCHASLAAFIAHMPCSGRYRNYVSVDMAVGCMCQHVLQLAVKRKLSWLSKLRTMTCPACLESLSLTHSAGTRQCVCRHHSMRECAQGGLPLLCLHGNSTAVCKLSSCHPPMTSFLVARVSPKDLD